MRNKYFLMIGLILVILASFSYVISLYLARSSAEKRAELFVSGMINDTLNQADSSNIGDAGSIQRFDQSRSAVLSEVGLIDDSTNGQNSMDQLTGDNEAIEICSGSDISNYNCYDTFFQKLTAQQGTAAAFQVLRAIYPTNSFVRSQCHPITHVIGRTAALKYTSVSDAYASGDSFCWSGFYHGVLEAFVSKIGYEKLLTSLNDICAPLENAKKYSFDHFNCVHGLGHGVMAVLGDDLFESLEACGVISNTWSKESCWGGVFMENVIIDNTYHTSRYLKPDDLHYPCNAVDAPYKQTCYLMQTSYMLKQSNQDFEKVFNLCRTAEENYVNTCYQSLGRDASGTSLSVVGPTVEKCDIGIDFREKSNCIIGAAKDFVSYFHGDSEALQFCEAWTDQSLKNVCLDTVTSYVKVL